MIVRHFNQNDLWDLTRFCGTLNVRCFLDNTCVRLIGPGVINTVTAGRNLLHALLYEQVSTELSNDLRPILLTWINCTPNISWNVQWSGGGDYLYIPKFWEDPTFSNGYNYLSIPRLKLIHLIKEAPDPNCHSMRDRQNLLTFSFWFFLHVSHLITIPVYCCDILWMFAYLKKRILVKWLGLTSNIGVQYKS